MLPYELGLGLCGIFAAPLKTANCALIVTYLPRLIKILNVVAKFRLDEFLRGRR